MKVWMKWAIVIVLLAALVGGVILATKLSKQPTGATQPPETTTESVFTEEDQALLSITYEEWLAMSKEEQVALRQEKFSSLKAHNYWFNAAKAAYEAQQDKIIIGPDQSIDINDMIANGQ